MTPFEKDIMFLLVICGFVISLLVHFLRSVCTKHLCLRKYAVQNPRNTRQTTSFSRILESESESGSVSNANATAALTSGSIDFKKKKSRADKTDGQTSATSSHNSLWNKEWLTASRNAVNGDQMSEYFNLF